MKKLIIYLVTTIIVLATTSCNKDKPPVGMYEATFTGTYQDGSQSITQNRAEVLWIINSYSKSIDMAVCSTCTPFSLEKGDNKSITGIIDVFRSGGGGTAGYSTGPISISGKWSKKDGAYIITGDFSYIYKQIDEVNHIFDTFVVVGPFEIKPYYD